MMPGCRDARERMVDHVYRELPADEAADLEGHLATCHGCREEWERLRRDLTRLDAWTAPLPPGGLRDRVLADLARRRAEAAERHLVAFRPERVGAATLSGAVAAGISLLLVSGAGSAALPPVGFGVVGAVWATFYAGALVLAGSRPFGAAARAALTGAGIAMILAAPLAIPRVVEVCARLVRGASGTVVFGVVVMVVAVGYTAGPLLIGGLAFGGATTGHRLAEGAKRSALYALLVAPAVYVQCLSQPLDVTAVWMAGAILGATLAGPLSLRLRGGWAASPS